MKGSEQCICTDPFPLDTGQSDRCACKAFKHFKYFVLTPVVRICVKQFAKAILLEMKRLTPIAAGVIILAAGRSRRMGRPKMLLPWGNTTVLGHLVAQWQALGV